MAVIKEGDWLDADDLEKRPDVATIAARVLTDDSYHGRCILCGQVQPDDVRWPGYAMEVGDPKTGESVDVEYRACDKCEPRLDQILFPGEVTE